MARTAMISASKLHFPLMVWAAVFACAGSAWAIPSPELVIGSVSSLSQLFALGAAMLGGGAVLAGVRTKQRAATARRHKQVQWAALALFLACLLSVFANFWQHHRAQNTRLARLQATLSRPAQFDGTKIRDANLKEASFAAQSENPLAMTTQAAAAVLEKLRTGQSSAVLLDVRERAENQMGTLPMSRHVRFPDLQSTPIDTTGKMLVLFCHNGNRSSETCAKLAAQGVECRFIAGGIEKWIVEGRVFTDESVRGLSDLRAIPDYQSRDVLLDTDQVKNLVERDDIQFVDVRYPGDFENQHLPGAINIPLRALPTTNLNQAISKLPKKPIIAACYDRRSCFMSQVLGLELAAKGYDFRGRYTVPWEYFIPKTPKPHIANWLAESQKTTWQKAVDGLAVGLNWMAQRSHILLAVFALAAGSRLLILPIALKAERDQITMAAVMPEMMALKTGLKDDPVRLTRAIRGFYRRHGLTPMRNLLALAFLPLMMLGLAAVQQVAADLAGGFLLFNSLALPDPVFLLPIVFTLLGGAYLHLALASTRRQVLLCWIIGAPVLFGLVFRLSALGNFYLCMALGLLLLQRGYVSGSASRVARWLHEAVLGLKIKYLWRGIIPLTATSHLAGCGNKVSRLSELLARGIDVPDGVVLSDEFLRRFGAADQQLRMRMLAQIWRMVGAGPVAVRSSAAAEDGENQSFAGVFESLLSVEREGLGQAITQVTASFGAERVKSYAGTGSGPFNILIQQMVDADYAGVMFTRDPQAAGMMVMEYVSGTADDLVSGRVTPNTQRFGRSTGALEDGCDCPVDVQALREIGVRAEQIFGGPQDIEWAGSAGRIRLVQSRDITASDAASTQEQLLQREWLRLTNRFGLVEGQTSVLEMDEMSEVLPRPTPLSLSYMQQIWAPGGSVDLACRRLGLRYAATEEAPSHLTTVFGRLYSDVATKARNAVVLNAAAVKRLEGAGEAVEQDFRLEFLPEFQRKIQYWEALDFDRLDRAALQAQLAELHFEFLHWTHVEIEMINIAASYFVDQARTACEAHDLSAQDMLGGATSFSVSGLLQQARRKPDDERRFWLHRQMGHRSVFDYELAEPRYSEMPEVLDMLLRPSIVMDDSPRKLPLRPGLSAELQRNLETARRYQSLKEEAKHHALRHLGVIRTAVLAYGRLLGLDGLVFYLSFAELFTAAADVTTQKQTAQERRDLAKLHGTVPPLPARLTAWDLELASSPMALQAGQTRVESGRWVSGSGPVCGRAYVVSACDIGKGEELTGFQRGDVLICEMVHPAWLPHVLQASAVVSEVGGWLSHMAIVARENGIPMLVGASGVQKPGNRVCCLRRCGRAHAR